MSRDHNVDPDKEPYNRVIGYFDLQVLAAYRNEPDKYEVQTDFFEGRISTTESYFLSLEEAGRADECLSVMFGYRTLQNGDLAIAAYLPDFKYISEAQAKRWAGFHIDNAQWMNYKDDLRFSMWVRRYMGGDWNVEHGVRARLEEVVRLIYGLTAEVVGKPILKNEGIEGVNFPAAENNHRYQDAHKELYGYLIDGLDKESIAFIADRLGRNVKIGSDRTVMALKKVFPNLAGSPTFTMAFDLVSEQRRLASHGVREEAMRFPAFEQFSKDLEMCLMALAELLETLEDELGVDAKIASERYRLKNALPKIVRPAEPHYSICQASRMKGKTVERVEFGFREDIEGVHGSELIIIHFTDGSMMSVDTGSNAGNIADDLVFQAKKELKAEDFHVSFSLQWVSGLDKRPAASGKDDAE
ncbi:MAG TPA: hypothetical protein VKA60_12215 [Blastocatellia bacterium]|nr:hypothetical protein [Blastocatellia bacterium]